MYIYDDGSALPLLALYIIKMYSIDIVMRASVCVYVWVGECKRKVCARNVDLENRWIAENDAFESREVLTISILSLSYQRDT